MGMLGAIHSRWMRLQEEFLARQAEASDYAGSNAALSKMLQSLVSSLLLGLGCYLALQGELGGGLMIVGSILGGRVLAPTVRLITGWRQIETALEAYKRLDVLLRDFPVPEKGMSLPPPSGKLVVEGVVGGPPNSGIQVLKGVAFRLEPGKSLAVVGPSGSGKTTLARLLVGVWPAMSGKVRLDGQDVYTWNKDELGKSIGYLPQDVELFEGTLAENIARFDEVDMDRVREACRLAGVDGVIEAFPDGFETEVGADGSFLSGGERQRVALARAVYGKPSFVVLDEPNASLDEEGDAALVRMLKMLRERGTTVVVITHRPSLLSAVEQMMVLIQANSGTDQKP